VKRLVEGACFPARMTLWYDQRLKTHPLWNTLENHWLAKDAIPGLRDSLDQAGGGCLPDEIHAAAFSPSTMTCGGCEFIGFADIFESMVTKIAYNLSVRRRLAPAHAHQHKYPLLFEGQARGRPYCRSDIGS
jgi:hypothetical protein